MDLATGGWATPKSRSWVRISSKSATGLPSTSTIFPVKVSKLLWMNSWQETRERRRNIRRIGSAKNRMLLIFLIFCQQIRESKRIRILVKKTENKLHLRGLKKTSKEANLRGLEDLKGLLQILVANALRHHVAESLLLVFLVVGEVALKPIHLRIAFKG